MTRLLFLATLLALWFQEGDGKAAYVPGSATPPAPIREFRGVWIATVNNIDWPSARGLPTAQQKAELLGILDRATQLNLNVVIFQVRPACDAFYASAYEPWSEYLTGRMGKRPEPYYDPLAFAIEECHRRGLELHAWFNPFRARHSSGTSPLSSSHISRTQPKLARQYGSQVWLDPGEPAIQQHSLAVILEVVKRYNIDGVHLDDYFYPYPERYANGKARPFPDESSWQRYGATGGKLSRDDWRRQNVDSFLQKLYQGIKAEKRAVKFGLSPFGIWRPGNPPQIKGLDAYAHIYADARKWFHEGWADYFAPQLYWAIDAKAQSFPVLLKWWTSQNLKQRHVFPGSSCYRHSPSELANQIRVTRREPGVGGNVLWSAKTLLKNVNNVSSRLIKEVYHQPALVPASPWLDSQPPGRPSLRVTDVSTSNLRVQWEPTGNEPVWLWLLQSKSGTSWKTEILPGRENSKLLSKKALPSVLALSAIDRCGNQSQPEVLEYK